MAKKRKATQSLLDPKAGTCRVCGCTDEKPCRMLPNPDGQIAGQKATEVLCILDGDFINENKTYGSGDFLHSKPGTVHGPHTTKKGCSFLALYTANTGEADPNDFFFAEAKRA